MNAPRFVVAALAAALLFAALTSPTRTSQAAETGKKTSATPLPKASATPEKAAATPAPKMAAEPAPAPATPVESGPPMAPDDLTGLKAKLGSVVTIEGIPVRAAESKSKAVRFLDFAGAGKAITVVFLSGKGEPIALEEVQGYVGKNIRVTGTVSEYSGKLQIAIEQKAQIVEVMP